MLVFEEYSRNVDILLPCLWVGFLLSFYVQNVFDKFFYVCSPIGKLELAAGDCLLMVADGPEFVSKHRNNSTFALVAKVVLKRLLTQAFKNL